MTGAYAYVSLKKKGIKMPESSITHGSKWRDGNVLACHLLAFLKTWLHEILWDTTWRYIHKV
jgi:hypothetical protein